MPSRCTRRQVLVVDDDRGVRETLTDVLREEGYAVDTANNGTDALSFLRERIPCVVLLDFGLHRQRRR